VGDDGNLERLVEGGELKGIGGRNGRISGQ